MSDIQNEHLLTDVFGRFPSFHDAEVVSISLNRCGRDRCAELEALVHVWEMTSQVDEAGRYLLQHHSLVKFRFSRIINLELIDFNQQNVLAYLEITKTSDRERDKVKFRVWFRGIHGVTARFHCEAVSIESVEPFNPKEHE
jgi:hypothetical protein